MQDIIIYEDQDIIIVNKPAGMPTQASQKAKGDDLYSTLQHTLNQREGKEVYLALHHRLDAATSGLVLFCKNRKFNKAITDLFREKKIQKKYMTMVDINRPIENQEWTIENKLIEYRYKHYKKAKSSKNGKIAITSFKVLKLFEESALIQCTPLTGRLHQIRVHLSEMGLPVQGDFHYNKNYKKNDFRLCAYFLSFLHPHSQESLTIEIPCPFI